MQMYGAGKIEFNKPLTKEAAALVNDVANTSDIDWVEESLEEGDTEFEFNDRNVKYFWDGEFDTFIAPLIPLGYVANGTVEYWGDYEGKYYINDNKVEDVDIAQTGLYEATDEELIEILTERGYTVTKEVA